MRPDSVRWTAPALWILAVLAVVFFLRAATALLIPIVLGALISFALEPVVAWLERRRVPRLAGTTIVMLSIAALCAWGVYSLRDDVVKATEALPETARRAREMLSSGTTAGPAGNVQEAVDEFKGATPAGTAGQQSRAPEPGNLIQRVAGSILSLAGNVAVVFFLVFFLLVSGSHFRQRLVEIAGPALERRRVTAQIIDDIDAQIQRFLLVRLATSAMGAGATWAVLAWMGVQQAAVWGILAGVFNSIPYFGPVIVSGGLLIVGLLQFGNFMDALKLAGAALVITSLEGWLLTPPLMGKAERMDAVVVFVGVLVWTWIWGGWGTILAVPMLVVVKAIADHVEALRPVSRLMAP